MSNTLIFIFIIIIGLIFLRFLFLGKSGSTSKAGSVVDIEENISALMEAENSDAFLIIEINGGQDFVQFSADSQGVQMDYPLITDVQKGKQEKFEEIYKSLGLKPYITEGNDGSQFLDCDINGSPQNISKHVHEVIAGVFNVTQNSPLNFIRHGF